ncbi:C2 family cysteine protease [Paracraurococcus lichenis]|uniref:C2 family cysteine protease n=1 Tax=Paracraurococcus lichenis TaxID=3064888 RepID=A0ABT9EA65_9PROT|nr:C2 family cysteine protease [Paracraurococcus sp. LOR1-02]MDO9713022.1 C2 family cysteine protease [Paracraurococcus sp. LOR1-02]
MPRHTDDLDPHSGTETAFVQLAADAALHLGHAGFDLPQLPLPDPLVSWQSSTAFSPLAVGGTALPMALYLTEAGTTTAISAVDIHQGQIGDCYVLSPLGEEALWNPSAIRNMIHDNGNGTQTVTLFQDASGHMPTYRSTAFKAVQVTVSDVFPTYAVNNGATQDVLNGVKEIWPQVIEKAFATLAGGYAAIAYGGYPALTMEVLTGHVAHSTSTVGLTEASLKSMVAAGNMLTFDTGSGSMSYGLVAGHCYMFDGVVGTGSTAAVHLLNPWGTYQPADVPVSQLSKAFVQLDYCHL